MDKENLKQIAIKIIKKAKLPQENTYGFDPLTILMIISIILTCIRILQECNKNKLSKECSAADKYALYGQQIKEFSDRRGWFTKMRIKKVLRREMKPDDYNQYSFAILNALLDTGETLTEEDVQTLVEAANV
jgi:hypothetical protein